MRIRDFAYLVGVGLAGARSIEGSGFDTGHIELRAFANAATDHRCGPGTGKCPEDNCCSAAGYCGTTAAHCVSPDCQIDFGRCDANKTPYGAPTTIIPRPHNGKAAYSPVIINKCTIPGTIALTFDDGPFRYTDHLLDLLDKYKARATFFVTGVNLGKGPIDDPDLPWVSMILRMQENGHQVASHTWSHTDLSKASHERIREEILKNEQALRNILGSFPTYMRPPYSRCGLENGCLQIMSELGYHVVLYDIDTKDYKNGHPDKIQTSKDVFDRALASSNSSDKSWLVIAHDVHEQSVHNLTEHMLKKLLADGYRPVTLGECLDDPKEFWYRRDDHFPLHGGKGGYEKSPSRPTAVSMDGTCGRNTTCLRSSFGDCCSGMNYCGNSTAHCGTDCQPTFGRCSLNVVSENLPEFHEEPEPGPSDDSQHPGDDKRKSESEANSVFRMGVGSSVVGLMAVFAAMVLLV